MRQQRKNISGVTLLEVMLVIAIGTSFLLMGAKAYQVLKMQSAETELQYNVEQVFIAAAKYYQANCKPQMNPITGAVTPDTGLLAPTTSYNPPNPFPIDLSTLIQDGYLDTNLPLNPIIDNAGPAKGYIIQYNQSTPVQKRIMTTSTTPLETKDIGNIIMWRIQVAVKVADVAMAKSYKNILGADCISINTGTSVQRCSGTDTPGGNYLVWERLPSLASPNADPENMTTNATIKQFNQLYETNPELFAADIPPADQQNYLCGS